jgi:predicted N-formylglutamate amidohydrolase
LDSGFLIARERARNNSPAFFGGIGLSTEANDLHQSHDLALRASFVVAEATLRE